MRVTVVRSQEQLQLRGESCDAQARPCMRRRHQHKLRVRASVWHVDQSQAWFSKTSLCVEDQRLQDLE